MLELHETQIVHFRVELNNTFNSLILHCEDVNSGAFINEKENIQDNLDEIHLKIEMFLNSINNNSSTKISSQKYIWMSDIKLPQLSFSKFSG